MTMARPAAAPTPSVAEITPIHRIFLVFLPFASGYFLSYYFRTVNAVLAGRLMSDLGLDAAQLGLMTAAYFLIAAAAQLPLGFVLDRYGPRRVQSCCLLVAGLGAYLFANAHDLVALFIARGLIGLGVASALLAGLKALAMSCPPQRLGLFNGLFMSLGATGAIAASLPTEALLQSLDWRQLFLALAVATFGSAALIWLFAPKSLVAGPAKVVATPGYVAIISDRGFWQLAPLSALAVGGAWALQGLWGAPWLRDVARLDQQAIALYLIIMAGSLSLAALAFGMAINALAKRGIGPTGIMSVASLLFILAEVALALDWPIPPLISWSIVAAFGAGTVLSYTINAQRFPKECIGRANSALNLLHFAAAFGVQSLFGNVVALWPRDELGHYPPEAYKAAFLGLAASQLVALLWFLKPIHRGAITPAAPPPLDVCPAATRTVLRTVVSIGAALLLFSVAYNNRDRVAAPTLKALSSRLWTNGAVERAMNFTPKPAAVGAPRRSNRWWKQPGDNSSEPGNSKCVAGC
jgi:MFS family permease